MTQIVPNDISGLAALNPGYIRAADRLAGIPPEQQLATLMQTPGVTPQTAMLIMKANLLREMLRGQPSQPPSPDNVAQDTDAKLQQAMARNNQQDTGIAGVSQPLFGQGFKAGGIVAFAGGDTVKANDPNAADTATFPQGYQSDDNSNLLSRFGKLYTEEGTKEPPRKENVPVTPVAPQADPAMVGKLMSGALSNVSYPGDGAGMSSAMQERGTKLMDQAARDVQAQLVTAKASQEADKPKTREEYEQEFLDRANAAGMNNAESERLLSLTKAGDYWEEQKNKTLGQSYIAAGQAQLQDAYEHRLPMSGLQNALRMFTVGAGAQAVYKTAADKAIMDAQQGVAQTAYALEDAIYKNKMGILDKGDTAYKNAVDQHNTSIKRVDDLVNAEQKAADAFGARYAVDKNASLMAGIYGRNPAFAYSPAILELEKQRAAYAAEHPTDLNGLAAYDEAIKRVSESAQGASSSTPSVVAARTRAEASTAIAAQNNRVKLTIAQMNSKQIAQEEQMLASLPPSTGNAVIDSMRANTEALINTRKAELARMGKSALEDSSTAAPSGTSEQAQQALDWANAHPNDPRAPAIKAKAQRDLGVS